MYATKTLLCATAALLAAAGAAAEEGWMQLFDGKSLDGWTPKIKGSPLGENYGDTFRVENGAIKVAYDRYTEFGERFGHLFYKTPYTDYTLRIEYRFVGEQAPGGPAWAKRNSGVMLHCQAPESMAVEQSFPVSIEVQFLGGLGTGERSTCNVCTPGTDIVMNEKLERRHCIDSTSPTIEGDAWVVSETEVRGNGTVKHFVNGQLVLEYAQTQLDDRDADAKELLAAGAPKMVGGGYIALQSESAPIEFRKVELRPLPKP